MPLPIVKKTDSGYHWATRQDYPQSIGRLSCFMGNAGILLRAYFYMLVLGKEACCAYQNLQRLMPTIYLKN